MNYEAFAKDLEGVVNSHSADAELSMPDFIVGRLLSDFVRSLAVANRDNDSWHGRVSGPNTPSEES